VFIDKKPVPKRYVAHDTLAALDHSADRPRRGAYRASRFSIAIERGTFPVD